jgi:hypothetical protein
MKYLIWLNTRYACGGIICDENGTVIDSCPIYYRRFVDRQFRDIEKELNQKRLLIEWRLASKYV